jgi:hypothetical protein
VQNQTDSLICVDLRGLVLPHQRSEIKQATGTKWGHAVASWLRHYAASRKVAGLRPTEVNFFSIYLILSATLGSGFTQPLTEMSTRCRKNNVSVD